MAATKPYIVAEVSKNWINGIEAAPGLLCERLELVIETNRKRGYLLHSFQLHRMMVRKGELNETIVAVFEATPLALSEPGTVV